MTQYAILTDVNKCVGCLACSISCKVTNDVPVGSYSLEILDTLGIDIAQLRTAVEIRSTESVKQMVSEGLGVGLIAQSAAQDYVQFGKLLAFPFPDSRFRRQLYIVKHKNSILSPIAQVFYDYARKAKDKASAK